MSKVKDENYFHVSGWMVNRLNLKGTDLCVYAIIYGFTQDGENWFEGTRQYLADFTGVSKTAIDGALSRLLEKGLLVRQEVFKNGVKFNNYKVAPLQETCTPPSKKLVPPPLQETCTHNIEGDNSEERYNNNPLNPPSYNDTEKDKIKETCDVVRKYFPRCNYPILADKATVAAVKRIAAGRGIDITAACEYLQERIKLYAECKYGADRQYMPEANNWLDNGGYDANENSWTKGTGNGKEQRFIPENF